MEHSHQICLASRICQLDGHVQLWLRDKAENSNMAFDHLNLLARNCLPTQAAASHDSLNPYRTLVVRIT
jgi:hypothetical protein